MSEFESWAWKGGFLVLCTLIGIIYKNLNSQIENNFRDQKARLDANSDSIGRHYSEINDLKVDHRELRTHILNHENKFNELSGGLEALSDMVRDGMNRLNDKFDSWRERRQ